MSVNLPYVSVFPTSRVSGNPEITVHNAFDILLAFLRTTFDCLGTIFPMIASFAVLVPKSVHLLC
ncbi:hypothetical protein P5673_022289 [Acropora cervicornis]|uniref:Uncharacterized protein n=1 Tax=Acropora cervicornis TaxID=6130 RepID=A0AAD9Q7C3_ACRCE|nr:hypothetical protein P5673_022289 [Acropora cervicornis]